MASQIEEALPEASPPAGPAPKALPEDTNDDVFEEETEEVPLSPMAESPKVKFFSETAGNRDAKVETGNLDESVTFVGFGKDELLKYADDPFWVSLRWFLFLVFWMVWIALFVGAILTIIYKPPRCLTDDQIFYQIPVMDLVNNVDLVKNSGIKTVIIADVLKHVSGNTEAVTNFLEITEEINENDFLNAIDKFNKEDGYKIILKLTPNHASTSHKWFNAAKNYAVRKPYKEVKDSTWKTPDGGKAWVEDKELTIAYLKQFPGDVFDLNFKNQDLINEFNNIFGTWRNKKMDGFLIEKASYLVENLNELKNSSATLNQMENVGVISDLVGKGSPQSPVFVELDQLDNPSKSSDTIQKYEKKGMTPILNFDVDKSTPDQIREVLEHLSKHPKAVVNTKLPASPSDSNLQSLQLVNFLAITSGSRALIRHKNPTSEANLHFLKSLTEFQKNHPRHKTLKLMHVSNHAIVAVLRSDTAKHVVVANFGDDKLKFKLDEHFKIPISKGHIKLVTPNLEGVKVGDLTGNDIDISGKSGVLIKLEE